MKNRFGRASKPKKSNPYAAAAIKALEVELQAAWAERDMDKCILLLRKVIVLDRRSPEPFLLIGRAYGMQFKYDEAIEAFDSALDLVANHERAMFLLRIGGMAKNFFDPLIAESYFQEAIELSGSAAAKTRLADFSLTIRKRDIAESLVGEVLAKSPADPAATLLWCRLHENQIEPCCEKLALLLRSQVPEMKAKAGYQLAKMLDLQGNYDGAMEALLAAKEALMPARAVHVQNRQKLRAKYHAIAQGFTAARRDSWSGSMSNLGTEKSIAMLGGHPRSGTTLLEQVLDSHPGIETAEETQIFYTYALSPLIRAKRPLREELDVLDAASLDDLRTARANYFAAAEACLGHSLDSKLLLDKNPSLTALIPALFRVFPETRFLTMIRDPRDVVLSCFMQSFVPVSGISGNYLTIEDTAAEYAGVMGVWTAISHLLEENALEIRYEEMVEDLQRHSTRILDFLGLTWNESVMNYDRHAREKIVRSPTANAVTEKVHTRAKNRWKNYQKHLEPVYQTLAPFLKTFGYE
jgi:tetratricopeptide (TPR) repeat protein